MLAGLPPPAAEHNTSKDPFVTVLMVGIFAPVVVLTGVMIMIDVDFTLELVIVVLLPVSAAFPIKPEVSPADVRDVAAPDPSQEA
jgi:hypothetical protein